MRRTLTLISTLVMAFLLATSSVTAAETLTVDFGNVSGGVHFVQGTPTPNCTVNADGSVTCPELAFELAGVGNKNATATLVVTYSAIVDCNNPGVNPNNPVESHTESQSTSASSGLLEPKNGRLTIAPITSEPAPTEEDFEALASCPNPNWTPEVRDGSLTFNYRYEVTFVGFNAPVILITGP
jgi:hypothetical protein